MADEKLVEAMLAALRPQMEAAIKEAQKRLVAEIAQVKPPKARKARSATPPPRPARDWTRETKRCPKCGETKVVDPGFGITSDRDGSVRAQSWCHDCRSKTNYHDRPRKYRTGV